jgi:hypothetical protein
LWKSDGRTANEEQLAADCRHNQEVHGGDPSRMIVEQPLPRLRPLFDISLATVGCATSMPSFSSSPWMRGALQSGFARLISRNFRKGRLRPASMR